MQRNRSITPLSQQLRRNATKEENLLWYNFLRKYPLQFRRQYVVSRFILDFYCHKARLAIELDGSQHYDAEALEKDSERTQYLNSLGIKVLRFTNLDVLHRFRSVCEAIDLEVHTRTPVPSPGEKVPRRGG